MISLSIRYMLARRRQTFLTLLGIFFGTAAFISLSSLMLGFREFLIDQLVNNSAHVHISVREEFLTDHSLDREFYDERFKHIFWAVPPSGRKDYAVIDNPQNWYRRLRSDPRVEGYSPQLTASVIFSKGRANTPAMLIGCDPIQQVKITTIGDYVDEGKWSDLAGGGGRIVLGDELKNKLGVRLFQNINVSLASGTPSPFKVVAFFKTGNKIADTRAYAALADVQRINATPNQVNEIAVRLKDFSQSAAMANAWSKISPEKIESWDQQNASFLNVFRFQDSIRYLSIGVILIVAGFGIYNVLNMTVMNKKRDIAILRSMGYETRDIIVLFFSQGLILGVVGAVSGVIFAYFFCVFLSTVPFGGGPLGGSLTGTLIMSFKPAIFVQAGFLGLLSSCVAALLPARTAGQLTPIEIIRSGVD